MNCPRCENGLERYALEGREAVACASCGYVGVPVEHRGESGAVESWEEALSRLTSTDRAIAATVETGDPAPAAPGDGAGPASSLPTNEVRIEFGDADELPTCDVCGTAFDSRRQLHGHSAVHADEEE